MGYDQKFVGTHQKIMGTDQKIVGNPVKCKIIILRTTYGGFPDPSRSQQQRTV